MEIWKDVVGYEGMYQVSNLGRVKSLEREIVDCNGKVRRFKSKILLNNVNKKRNNYCSVILSNSGVNSRFFIHRLVATAFISNVHDKPQVNHIDGNPLNNKVYNLEWCTSSENLTHRYRVLGSTPVRPSMKMVSVHDIDGILIDVYDSIREAARQTNSDSSSIVKVCKGKYKYHNGLIFKYLNCGS